MTGGRSRGEGFFQLKGDWEGERIDEMRCIENSNIYMKYRVCSMEYGE